jgi:hypothetical protein
VWQQVENLHSAILQYKGGKEKLLKTIAEAFWLGIHAMITRRGTGLYMKMSMALWLSWHNLPLPELPPGDLAIDMLALSVTEKEFASMLVSKL